jgi:nucleotide-binding universal stress UspA family protein
LDDSPSSHAAARFVCDYFEGDDVLGINVAELPRTWIAPGIGYGMVFPPYPVDVPIGGGPVVYDGVTDLAVADARELAARELAATGLVEAMPVPATGDPVEAIVRAAAEHHADMIVVGRDDTGLLGRLLDRSVTRALLREAHCPILVVPAPQDEDKHENEEEGEAADPG